MKQIPIYATVLFGVLVITLATYTAFSIEDASAKPELYVDYYFESENRQIILNPGETKIISSNLMMPKEKALDAIVGITLAGKEGIFLHTGVQLLPEGISATVDKNSIKLSATQEHGVDARDSVQLTIKADSDVSPGEYPISVFAAKKLAEGEYLISGHDMQLVIESPVK